MERTKESLLKRREKLIHDIEQIFLDAEHWNTCVRQPDEALIDPDPDGVLRKMLATLKPMSAVTA